MPRGAFLSPARQLCAAVRAVGALGPVRTLDFEPKFGHPYLDIGEPAPIYAGVQQCGFLHAIGTQPPAGDSQRGDSDE